MNRRKCIVRGLQLALAIVALHLWPAAGARAQAVDAFKLVKSPGGIEFWHLQRDAWPRAVVLGNFLDSFALAHPEKIATALVASALSTSGPKDMPPGEFNEQVKDLRGNGSLGAQAMQTSFFVEARPADIGEALDLYFGSILNPALREEDFSRLRQRSRANRARMLADSGSLSNYLLNRLTLDDGPFGRWSDPDEIEKITAEDVAQWRREVLARDNLVISAIGNLDAAQFGAMIDRTFGKLPEYAVAGRAPTPKLSISGKTVVLERETAQTAIAMQGELVIEPAEAAAVNIASNVLGGGLDRRLSRAVRGEQGATYGIGAGIGQPFPGVRTFSIRTQLANDLALAALTRAREVYSGWRSGDVSEDEAAPARALLSTQFEKATESPAERAFTLMQMLRTHRSAKDEAEYAQRTRDAPLADINQVLREKMPTKFTTLIIAPKADSFHPDCVIHAVSEVDKCR